MSIEIRMPALSPTMEEGTLARWLVDVGSQVRSGDVLAEIETNKATMEFEAAEEGTITEILIPEGSDGVRVGTTIAILAERTGDAPPAGGEVAAPVPAPPTPAPRLGSVATPAASGGTHTAISNSHAPATTQAADVAIPSSPLARRLARRLAQRIGVDLASTKGSGPAGMIVRADLGAGGRTIRAAPSLIQVPRLEQAGFPAPPLLAIPDVPHDLAKLSNMRKTIARRLTESKQTVPHIYLTVDLVLDPLLTLRREFNARLEGQGLKISVNDMLVKALALALIVVPSCNVMLSGDQLVSFRRSDISVAVSVTNGLLTPVVAGANAKGLGTIAREIRDMAERARAGKLAPHEYAGGTASISNLGMYGIKQFEAVINPPQGMIMAVGEAQRRAWPVGDDVALATVLSATGSFDHRAIDGAALMAAFKDFAENPMKLLL